ncbi:MAG: hypothetical protein HZB70_04070 [Candidatus Berkelbacteria bacterium]|nr:MAG: hypothetical protein HZB70_04070 [Candidatus Berkelbacteria bacterium]QQG51523.1 MAG: hypothetical protein HY845_03120 [Candidatus Berkelbacteria bacterium]
MPRPWQRRHKALLFVLSLLISVFPVARTRAALVTSFSDTLATIKESVPTNHTLRFTINDSWDENDTITIDFPNTFNTSGFADSEPEDYDVTDDGVDQNLVATGGCTGAANEVQIAAVNTTTDTFTFTRCAGDGAIANGSIITIEIGTNATFGAAGNDQITNQTAAENDTDPTVTLGGTFGGSGTLALEIVIDNDSLVSVTVLPRISCVFGGMTVTFPDATGTVITAATNTTITAGTNAQNGFSVTVYDQGNGTNPGLYKGSAPTYLIGSANSAFGDTATLATNVDGFGIQGTATQGDIGSATLTIAARYNQAGNNVGGLEINPAGAQTLASTTGPANNTITTVTHKMAASMLAPSGTYTDTLTYVCTGIF